MSELHILDAGRADCTVLLLDTPQGRQTVVVDGGGKYYGARRPLLEFLTQRNISDIDLLILTHLHQDHFGGFVHLVDQVQVRRAVAPCRDLQFADRVYPVFGDQEFYREYHTFFQYLNRSGTELIRSKECAGRTFTFGDFALDCLYPMRDSTQRSVTYAEALCAPELTEEAMAWNLEAHKQTCNEDSSIWLLRKGGADLALLAGDSTDETMRAALCGRTVRPRLQKLSHHGICARYFSEYVQKIVKPEILVVSVDKIHYTKEMGAQVDALCAAGGSQCYYTFQGDVSISL
ncbi:ComEC/Rec2 family competence protein [Dysosmobacter welbionis]|jgi:beta-lactamase superfamily II metal-dependent hydrolase|uniref:ComEC/Rec2 family competence protein n=1 Tax=Dysosmobacter welbionis TaxID=2093857 RepID=UPI00266F22C9|nr:MBL fold metallo-hydrolase [Dysosmobacter welbionis]